MLRLIGEIVGVTLGICAILAMVWRVLVLPNLREEFGKPLKAAHRQLTENRHVNPAPTVLDKLDDLEMLVEAVGLNQEAVLRRLGRHIAESEQDRARLWLVVESLIHEDNERKRPT